MVLHNPNNWHWVNKDASTWAKDYFERNLVGVSATDKEGASVRVAKVLSIEGDVDTAAGDDVSGTIMIPEVAHDTEPEEYVFEIVNSADSNEKQPVRDLVRSSVTPQLRSKLSLFAHDLMEQHGKDIQHTKENDPRYRSSPAEGSSGPSSSQPAAPARPADVAGSGGQGQVVNTTDITENFEFQTTAEELYQTFVNPQRVAAFTRSPPEVFEPSTGGLFKLFSGNVEGEFLTLDPAQRVIVQKWRLLNWPKGHFSTMSIVFDQGLDTTTLRLSWKGVPIGQEEATRRNFAEYYVRSIKLVFG
ncbi:hypothetical protein DRE_07218 [Drechslerella stenobrocha 248]|uniref:Activator of Hsp90 ATPase AHSA1-like N-terminal domain-containing protein n=1 Tax=Drechslerella stenobrocha 248 TaxID=1043628 RepID=W7HW11_9PEZI|nr:hypothetical protein DRE_07218 [Drechslerella stenobrocha 248]